MNGVTCDFCWRHCSIAEGRTGICSVRRNQGGILVTEGYGKIAAMAVDPVEKKPLYHFLPGSKTFSLALFGCNFTCGFCQNYAISQKEYRNFLSKEQIKPEKLVQLALEAGCPSISYTYSEPLVWQDYMIETAILARKHHLKNIMVTNGSFSLEALHRIVPLMDGFNIDVKGDAIFYTKICGGSLEPVLDAISYILKEKVHLEVTTMIMENFHTPEMIGSLGKNLKELGVQIWHLSRFFPCYRFSSGKPTSEAYLLEMLGQARLSAIPYIYGGNSSRENATYCPSCDTCLMTSHSYDKKSVQAIENGCCAHCGSAIYGVFS